MVNFAPHLTSGLDPPLKRRTLDTQQDKSVPSLSGYRERNVVSSFFEALSIDDISSPDEFYNRLDVSHHQREIICKYIRAMHDLAGILGRKLMEGCGLTGDLFSGWDCHIRMNKYHFGPENLGLMGLPMHTDPSFITILQDDENVDGLQVVHKYSDEIVAMDPVPGTLAVNIGDIGQAWSNGRFYNVKHRVCSVEPRTRYSIVLSVMGPKDKKVESPSELIDSEHPRLYVPIDLKAYQHFRTSKRLHTGGTLELFRTTMS